MPEGLTERVLTPTGIPQGSPLSPTLYLFYKPGLIESYTEGQTSGSAGAENLKRTVAYGWVEDLSCPAAGMSKQDTVAKLQVARRRAQCWATKPASVFAPPMTSYFTLSTRKLVRLARHQLPWRQF
jgi:hypothetical protein